MKRIGVTGTMAAIALTAAPSASALTLKTNWAERTELSSGGTYTTSVWPSLPHTLGAGKSWFATIEGPTAKLPRDRLLRIGFGYLVRTDGQYNTELSTTHQFKLPRRL